MAAGLDASPQLSRHSAPTVLAPPSRFFRLPLARFSFHADFTFGTPVLFRPFLQLSEAAITTSRDEHTRTRATLAACTTTEG